MAARLVEFLTPMASALLNKKRTLCQQNCICYVYSAKPLAVFSITLDMLRIIVRSLATLCCLLPFAAQAQVGIGTTTPHPHAVLHLHHGTVPRGFLLPRMSTAERTTLGGSLAPTDFGMMVADTSMLNGGIYVWGGTVWDRMFPVDSSPWTKVGNQIFPADMADVVGIGTNTPLYLLDVSASRLQPLARIYNTDAASGASVLHLRTNANDINTDLLRATSPLGDVMLVRADGSIGMGVPPLAGAQVFIRSNRSRTLRVENTGTVTATDAIFAENSNNVSQSTAIKGSAVANTTNQTFGVQGITNSTHANAAGVYGGGQGGAGVWGLLNHANQGSGVIGQYSGTAAGSRGVTGGNSSNANASTGVYGDASASATNATYGVYGTTNSNNVLGAGVYGIATAGSNGMMAVNNAQSSAFALRVDRGVTASTANIASARIGNTSTSNSPSINKIGLVIENTGAWTGATARNIGLQVDVNGGTQNIAAVFNGGNVGVGTNNPDPKALLDLTTNVGTPRGFLLPRVSTTVRTGALQTGLGLGQRGLMVADTTTGPDAGLYVWSGANWGKLATGTNAWSKTGNYTYTDFNKDSVGIGMNNPSNKLHVAGGITATGIRVLDNAETDVIVGVFAPAISFDKPAIRLLRATGTFASPECHSHQCRARPRGVWWTHRH